MAKTAKVKKADVKKSVVEVETKCVNCSKDQPKVGKCRSYGSIQIIKFKRRGVCPGFINRNIAR